MNNLTTRLKSFDTRLEEMREKLRIPGLALVIIKDGSIVYLKGKGYRNLEERLPATEDTLFAIGSTTKAFTALLVLMAVEEGKLALEDSPKKCLPYFALKDPEADQKITLRHLLTHTSGLAAYNDLGSLTGKLSKEEVIRLAGRAEPIAKLGKEFHYNNVMYLAAGECVAAVMGKPYPDLLRERIFDPLGMKNANTSVAKTLTLPARAVGYHEFGEQRARRPVPMRPLDHVAPAGAINASARDMGQWLRLLLGRGAVDGQRLISEKNFARLWQPYIEVGPFAYGLGWGLDKWNGKSQVAHDGGIDGFVTRVALLPEENIAFGLFTNIDNGEIHGWVTNEVFSLFTSAGGAPQGTGGEAEAGTYGVLGGLKAEVAWTGRSLVLRWPDRPESPLERLEGRRYRLGAPAPAGLFATFRPKEDDPARTELFLEQPWGDVVLNRLTQAEIEAAQKQSPPTELLALVGAYRPKDKLTEVRLEAIEGRVSLVIPGQPPAPLLLQQEDEFGLGGLPATFALTLRRDEHGAVSGFALKEPGVTLDHQRVGPRGVPDIPIDALERRVAQAHGAERLARLKTLVLAGTVDFVHEGVTGTLAIYREAPERYAEVTVFQAFDRDIGRARLVFDGERAADSVDFAPIEDPYPAQADDIRVRAWFNPCQDWKTRFPSVRLVGHSQVGREDVIVVELERASGVKLTEYYSKKTYLLRKRERLVPGLPGRPTATTTEVYDDYQQVAGVMIPHRIEAETWNRKVVTVIREAQPNAPIPPGTFALPNAKLEQREGLNWIAHPLAPSRWEGE